MHTCHAIFLQSILHAVASDWKSNKPPKSTVIIDVYVSNFITRNDNFNNKGIGYLKPICI